MSDRENLRTRIPGQSLISEVVRTHLTDPGSPWWARALGASPLSSESRGWLRGALAELAVARTLDELGQRWDVLHAVPLDTPESDIDHLLIGAPGVFTITTKDHRGEDVVVAGTVLRAAGKPQSYIGSSLAEAQRAGRLLEEAAGMPIAVTPVLVLVRPHSITMRQPLAGVHVLSSRELDHWLHSRPARLTGDQVAAISDVADRIQTWRGSPRPGQDLTQLRSDFLMVRSKVRTALRRRVLWAGASLLVLYTTLWGAVAVLVTHAVGP